MAQAAKQGAFLFYKQNRELLRAKTGRPKIQPSPLGSQIIMLAFFIAISGFSLLIVSSALNTFQILAESRAEIGARITGKTIEKDADGANEYWVRYEYVVNDRAYTGRDLVSREEYDGFSIGTPITVTYSPAQPDVSVMEYNPSAMLAFTAIFVGAFVLLIAVFLFLIARWSARQRLINQGKIIRGVIEDVSRHTDDEGLTEVMVHYSFESPTSGKVIEKKMSAIWKEKEIFGRPGPGAQVLVLYLNDRQFTLL